MPMQLRPLNEDEWAAVRRLAHSRTESARVVERARIVWLAAQGASLTTVARTVQRSLPTVRLWLGRFNAQGVAGLQDTPRAGRPPRYTAEQVGQVIELALTDPDALDLPFGCWTLDRLQYYANEVLAIPIKRARIGQLLLAEGLRWRSQETWFGERVDPAFAEKRGPLSGSIPSRRRAARSSVWTNSAPRRPRVSAGGSRSHHGQPPGVGRSARSRKLTMGAGAKGTSSERSCR
jgi:transposase